MLNTGASAPPSHDAAEDYYNVCDRAGSSRIHLFAEKHSEIQ